MNSALKLMLVKENSAWFSITRLFYFKKTWIRRGYLDCTTLLNQGTVVPATFFRPLSSHSFISEQDHATNSSSSTKLNNFFSIAHKSMINYGRLSPEDVTSLIKESKHTGSLGYTQSLFLIRCLGSPLPEATAEAKVQMLDQVLEIFKSCKMPLDITHYNYILAVYLENGVIYSPLEFLAMLENKRITPNKVTFQKLVSSLCQRGDLHMVTEILNIMKKRNIGINIEILNAIVKGYSLNGDWETAQQTIESMSNIGLEPDAKTFCGLIDGYAKHGCLKPISRVIEQCKAKEIFIRDKELLDASYVAAINGYSRVLDYLLSLTRKDWGFNRACVNLIFRLITEKREEAAFKVLLSMKPIVSSDGRTLPSGNFFIRHLVKSGCHPEKIIKFCQELVASGRNNRAFFKALEVATVYNKTTLTSLLMRKIQGSKDSAKPYLFAPLLASKARVSGEDGVLSFLWEMKSMGAGATVDIVTRCILPHLTGDVETLLRKLLDAGISFYVSVVSLLRHSIEYHDFNSAIWLASNYYTGFDTKMQSAVVKAYLESRDAPSLSKLVRALLPQPREIDEDDDLQDSSNQLIDCLLKEISSQSPSCDLPSVMFPLLKELSEQKLSISFSTSQHLRGVLGDENQSLDAVLGLLESNKLVHCNVSKRLDVGSETAVKGVKDFNNFARSGDVHNLLKCKEVLEAKNVPLTDGMNVSLMMTHLKNDSTDEALSIFTRLVHDGIKVNLLNLLSLTAHLLKKNRAEDAFYTLDYTGQPRSTLETHDRIRNGVLRILNIAASQGDANLTRKLFDTLQDKVAVTIDRSLLSPLIKVHLIRGNLSDALDEFKRCVNAYRSAPCKSQLFEKVIESEDSARLSQLIELSNKVDGEMNTLHDLAFAYLHLGRLGNAESVFQTPGLRALNNRLDDACRYYASNSRVREMEDLLSVTRHLFNADRLMLYSHVLDAYVEAGVAPKALDLWQRMLSEQQVASDDKFLLRLGNFLLANGCHVPFVMPSPIAMDAA